jgi:release factor glutamine methyltransferase
MDLTAIPIMKNAKSIYQDLLSRLNTDDEEEDKAIAWLLIEHFLQLSKTDVLAGKSVANWSEMAPVVEKAIRRINGGEPVQYVLGVEYFLGRAFQVNPSVLIPRPETEELVRAVLAHVRGLERRSDQRLRIVDIGTGTACIPVVLFLQIENVEMFATDISTAALSVAVHNAEVHNATITFIEHDIIHDDLPVGDFDVVVSNPPYIPYAEKAMMKENVLAHEPSQALFVPDDDPLLFYRQIADRAFRALKPGGLLAVEINERYGNEVAEIFAEGYQDIALIHDASGKNRVVKGIRRV